MRFVTVLRPYRRGEKPPAPVAIEQAGGAVTVLTRGVVVRLGADGEVEAEVRDAEGNPVTSYSTIGAEGGPR